MTIKELINYLSRFDLETQVMFQAGAYDDAGYYDTRDAELTNVTLQLSSYGEEKNVVILVVEP